MLRRPIVATAVIVALVLTCWIAGIAAGARKLAPVGPLDDARGSYRINLGVAPERFHQLVLQDRGRLVGVNGKTVLMKDVGPGDLRAIAREYWVDSIERWSGS